MMKNILILFLLFTTVARAQKVPDYGFNKVRIVDNDKVIQADLQPVGADFKPQNDRVYYWSSSNTIQQTQGGFSGKLLNGSYAEYYANKNLKVQGQFNKGLKNGIWKSWSEQGVLIQLYTWDNGVRSGKFELFQENGQPKQKGEYRNNSLNGRLITYLSDDKTEEVTYKNGRLVEKKKSQLLRKLNIFKKTRRDTTRLQR